jgi:hypothetical protein
VVHPEFDSPSCLKELRQITRWNLKPLLQSLQSKPLLERQLLPPLVLPLIVHLHLLSGAVDMRCEWTRTTTTTIREERLLLLPGFIVT